MERPAELCLMILTTGPVSAALRKDHVGVFGIYCQNAVCDRVTELLGRGTGSSQKWR